MSHLCDRFEPGYFADKSMMSAAQKKFYSYMKRSLKRQVYVDVDGQLAYLFVYLHEMLKEYGKSNSSALSDNLLALSEMYSNEPKIVRYCEAWGLDCLLLDRRYEEFLVKTEPVTIIKHTPDLSNLRVCLQEILGLDVNRADFLMMFKPRYSKYAKANEVIFKDKIYFLLDGYLDSINKSLMRFLADGLKSPNQYEHGLFIGSSRWSVPKSGLMLKQYSHNTIDPEFVSSLGREAENLARESLGQPLIGEGWISETLLYQRLKEKFPQTQVVQHGRPFWLGRQHYDIWFPMWGIAVEYHGRQHFESVDFFGGHEVFIETVARDKRKQRLSEDNGVLLIVVEEGYDFDQLVFEIYEHRAGLSPRCLHL